MARDEAAWLDELRIVCVRIGRSLNDAYGLIHSFCNCRQVTRETLVVLNDFGVRCDDWGLAFELRIKRTRWVRIYADMLVIVSEGTIKPAYSFSQEFKMKGVIDSVGVMLVAKYLSYLEVVFDPSSNVVPALCSRWCRIATSTSSSMVGESSRLLPVTCSSMPLTSTWVFLDGAHAPWSRLRQAA